VVARPILPTRGRQPALEGERRPFKQHDPDLADLDAEIEAGERGHEAIRRELEALQDACEAEAVDQAEREGERDPEVVALRALRESEITNGEEDEAEHAHGRQRGRAETGSAMASSPSPASRQADTRGRPATSQPFSIATRATENAITASMAAAPDGRGRARRGRGSGYGQG
jgi:hypothetical protein